MERWQRDEAVLWRAGPAGALVVLAPGDSEPFVVRGRGLALWSELAEPATVEELVARLAERFAADPAVITADIEPVLGQLDERGAIRRAS
jgi:hypothetical protein